MDLNERVKLMLGDQAFTIAFLQNQLEEVTAKVQELEKKDNEEKL